MPVFRYLTFALAVFFCSGGMMLHGDETPQSFVVPEHQAQVSFSPSQDAPNPKRQLMSLAHGFSGTAPTPASPVVPASYTAEPEDVPEEPEAVQTTKSDNLLHQAIGFKSEPSGKGKMERPKFSGSIAPLVSVFGSLLVVLSAFLILVLLFKKVSPKGNRVLPKEAFEDLGRTFLTQKLQLHLLRLGNRLILVSVTPDGVSPITEVTDPDEVVPLLGMCRKLDTNSSSALFRKTLSNFAGEDAQSGYFGVDSDAKTPVKSKSSVDLYSDPDESLAVLLASGLKAKGGKHD